MDALPKDICQYMSKYIEETPEAWEAFKVSFRHSNQAIMVKKREVLSTPVWVELHVGDDWVRVAKFHDTRPEFTDEYLDSAGYRGGYICSWGSGGGPFKVCVVEKTMGDLINNDRCS